MACSAMGEWAFESHSESLPVEVVEVISRRKQELELVEGVLDPDDELYPQVHTFLEELAGCAPPGTSASWLPDAPRSPPKRGTRGSPRPCESSCEALRYLRGR